MTDEFQLMSSVSPQTLSPDPSPGPPSTITLGEGRPLPPQGLLLRAFLPPLPGRARRVGWERGAGGERDSDSGATPIDYAVTER